MDQLTVSMVAAEEGGGTSNFLLPNGTFFPEVEIHFCATIKNKQEPYLTYKLQNVIVTGYGFHGNATGSPLPSEEVTLGYSEVEWNYITLDPETGDKKGNVPAKYNPAKGKS